MYQAKDVDDMSENISQIEMRNKALENMNSLSNKLGQNISIQRGWNSGSGVLSAFECILRNPNSISYITNKKRENIILFNTKDSNILERYARFEAYRKLLRKYSRQIADHQFTIKGKNNKTIGYGFSPYINLELGYEEFQEIKNILIRMLDCMHPKAKDTCDIIILDPSETIYSPGKSITILFIKK